MQDPVTIRSVYTVYRKEKLAQDLADDWSYLFYRAISIPLTPLLAWLRIRPVTVTLWGLAVALLLPVLAARGGAGAWWQVGIGAIVFSVCDALDGDLARATDQRSAFGAFLDSQVDLVYRLAMYAAIGLLAHEGFGSLWGVVDALGVMLASVAFVLLARLAREGGASAGAVAGPAADVPLRMPGLFGLISGIDHFLPVLLLLAGAAGHTFWLVWWLLGYSLLDYLSSQVDALRAAR